MQATQVRVEIVTRNVTKQARRMTTGVTIFAQNELVRVSQPLTEEINLAKTLPVDYGILSPIADAAWNVVQ